MLVEAARRCDALLIVAERSPGPRAGVHRRRFHLGSLAALDRALGALDQGLHVLRETPGDEIPRLAERLGARGVWVGAAPGSEERATLGRLERSLPETCRLHVGRDNRLFDALPIEAGDWPMSFSKFRRKVERNLAPDPALDAPAALPPPPAGFDRAPPDRQADDCGIFAGGEAAGRKRLDDYVFGQRRVLRYKQTRNGLLSFDDSTKFSPWLANGCLSVRRVWSEVERFESGVEANQSTYWVKFELLWREYFRWLMDATGSALFRAEGLADVPPEWRADAKRLQAWREGMTGVPLVDAAMRELAATGYMSNRARQNVASFLVKDLAQDWREGAAWFERQLVDYDVASNWGNWAYQAGTGTDTRERWFNVIGQARRYDPDAEYLAHWLPELRELPSRDRFVPWKAAAPVAEYPAPVVEDPRWS